MSHLPNAPAARPTSPRWARRAALVLLVPMVALGALACSSSSNESGGSTATTAAPQGGEPVREILGRFPAAESPGYEQILMRVTIPPGAQLAPHTHPGFEVGRIEQGALTYTILQGTAAIGRGGSEEPTEEVTGPAQVVLQTGDTVYEPHDMHHEAANRGDVPVVVLLASLIEIGQPIAISD